MSKFRLFVLVTAFLSSVSVIAEERDPDALFVIEGGYHNGGDTIRTIPSVNGESETIKAGSGFSLGFGVRFDVQEDIEAVVTYGSKIDGVRGRLVSTGEEVEFTFSRSPLNGLVMFKKEDWHFGAGLTYHMNVEYEANLASLGSSTEKFKNALGVIADFRYFFSEGGYVGGRYTNIEYESESTGKTYDGSSVGVIVGVYL
ncbi:MAG: hypothetical protein OEY52_07615 [Gammaproteobacteria bacterium]|nr:hypothetical protein [Gammaproteobacteria bacterium]